MPSKRRFPAAALLFLAFLCQLSAAQAGKPATPAQSSKSNKPAHASTAPGTPAEAQPATPGTSTSPACPNGPCDYEQPHITIATPAPAPAPWLLPDRIRWAAEVLLLILAYPALLFGLSTLRKIERQTQYAETAALAAADSAKAALLFAENQARADRPWILISTKPTPGVLNGFSVVATNRGRSPARIVSLAEGMIFVQDEAHLPSAPVFKTAPRAPLAPIILVPGESASIKTFQRDEVKSICENPEQVLRVEEWKEKIYLYGKVAYTELVASGDEVHDSGWCCWYIHGRQKSGMIMAGPLDYNRHT
ncbi:MAG: hypothetical protein ABSA42_21700 [Terracidiphilus sp.]|jgi:hypothetical protein